jgi:hypothetical protein
LHTYSGEIFKFDLPKNLEEPNCIPTADAMHWALPAGDRACVFPPDNTEAGTFASAELLSPNEPCTTTLARALPRAKSVVRYIHVSALLAGTPESLALSDSANTVLGALCSAPGTECSTDSLAKALEGLLDAREELGAYAHIES